MKQEQMHVAPGSYIRLPGGALAVVTDVDHEEGRWIVAEDPKGIRHFPSFRWAEKNRVIIWGLTD